MGEVTRPFAPQHTAPFELAGAGIGGLDAVPNHMRQGSLHHLPGIVRCLRRPTICHELYQGIFKYASSSDALVGDSPPTFPGDGNTTSTGSARPIGIAGPRSASGAGARFWSHKSDKLLVPRVGVEELV